MSILDDLPDIFSDALGETVFYDAKLVRHASGTGPAYDPGDGTVTYFACKALVTNFSNYSMSSGLVAARDRKVLILAATLSSGVPIEGDDVMINGETFRLTSENGSAPAVKIDPSKSVFTCRGRA